MRVAEELLHNYFTRHSLLSDSQLLSENAAHAELDDHGHGKELAR